MKYVTKVIAASFLDSRNDMEFGKYHSAHHKITKNIPRAFNTAFSCIPKISSKIENFE